MKHLRPGASRGYSFLSHSAGVGGVDGVTGLYTVGGLDGLLTGFTFACLGFFFSLRRASLLPTVTLPVFATPNSIDLQ